MEQIPRSLHKVLCSLSRHCRASAAEEKPHCRSQRPGFATGGRPAQMITSSACAPVSTKAKKAENVASSGCAKTKAGRSFARLTPASNASHAAGDSMPRQTRDLARRTWWTVVSLLTSSHTIGHRRSASYSSSRPCNNEASPSSSKEYQGALQLFRPEVCCPRPWKFASLRRCI